MDSNKFQKTSFGSAYDLKSPWWGF